MSMAEMFYQMFWKECGTHDLDTQQKVDALCKLRDLSLRIPYWHMDENEEIAIVNVGHQFCQVPNLECKDCRAYKRGKCAQKLTLSDMFSELVPNHLCQKHTHLSSLTGLLLYTMHMEIFNEIKQLAENGELTQEQIKQIGEF